VKEASEDGRVSIILASRLSVLHLPVLIALPASRIKAAKKSA
jgi:hypothetical protein